MKVLGILKAMFFGGEGGVAGKEKSTEVTGWGMHEVGKVRRVHGATPHPYQRRRQGGSTPLIKYPLVLELFMMPQKYALLVAYKADCGGRGCAAQHRGPF
jgi:hypothetical protein